MTDERCHMCGGTGRCNVVAHSQGPDTGCAECHGSMVWRCCKGTGRR